MLPAGEVELVGHVEHAAEPAAFLYVSAAQTVQDPPSGPEWPGSQRQSVSPVLPAGEVELVGHVEHAAEPEEGL